MKHEYVGRYSEDLEKRELKRADKYIKSVIKNAEFYIDFAPYSLAFERLRNEEELDLDYHTLIGGIAYKGTFTNGHEDLIKPKGKKLIKFEEIKLF